MISNNIEIACLNETKLNPNIRFSHNLFYIFRLDNQKGIVSRKGVVIVEHKSIQCQVMSSFNTEVIEASGVTVNLLSGQILMSYQHISTAIRTTLGNIVEILEKSP